MGPSIEYVRKIFRKTIISNPCGKACIKAFDVGMSMPKVIPNIESKTPGD